MEISLLISCNCPKAIKPTTIIRRKSDDPITVPLGDYAPESSCHGILSREVVSGTDNSQLGFVFNGKMKEVINPSAINQVFELNFMEHKSNTLRHEPSNEDRKFLKTSVQGIHWCDNGHYELPLPLSAYHIICLLLLLFLAFSKIHEINFLCSSIYIFISTN